MLIICMQEKVFTIFNNLSWFKIFHSLYVQSEKFLLADVLENFRNKCIETYDLDLAYFFISTWISMAVMFKGDRNKLELLTDIHMLLMVEKGIRGGICHAIHRYAEANNKYMRNYDKNKESILRCK